MFTIGCLTSHYPCSQNTSFKFWIINTLTANVGYIRHLVGPACRRSAFHRGKIMKKALEFLKNDKICYKMVY